MSFYPLSENQFPDCAAVMEIRDARTYHTIGSGKERGALDYVMSRSELLAFADCPHKWLMGIPRKTTSAMLFGDLVDCLIVAPESFSQRFVMQPTTYETTRKVCPKCGSATDAKTCRKCKCDRIDEAVSLPWSPRSEHCQAWLDEQELAGLDVISSEFYDNAMNAVASFDRAKKGWLRDFRDASDRQVQLVGQWIDEDEVGHTGTSLAVPIKALLDLMPTPESDFGDTLGDLKTTRNAELRAWTRDVYSHGLHVQAALYLDLANALTGLHYANFAHLIVENSAPFEATFRMLSQDFLTIGRVHYTQALRDYCAALKSGSFREYDSQEVEPERWMF